VTELIRLETADGVAVLTLNRPEKLNAFAGDMREQAVAALDRVAADPGARVLVITGAGRAFCSGGDVHHMVALKRDDAGFEAIHSLLAAGREIVTRVSGLPIPTIAAVHGVAAGAGMNLALACDVRVASDQASFGETFARIGLHPDWGGTYFLPRLVGLARALELCWTGDVIDAAEALRIGLVNRVFPHAEFEAAWRGLAGRIAAGPRTSIGLAKRNLHAALRQSLDRCIEAETAAQEACWRSPDSAEGLAAFAAKRTPVFSGGGVVHDAPPTAAARHFE
jgi:2-(1,2-epoxy-1,2-dihydrophenyl)acetyl-CoA isomerase